MLFRVSQTTSENYESIAAGFVKFGRRNLSKLNPERSKDLNDVVKGAWDKSLLKGGS